MDAKKDIAKGKSAFEAGCLLDRRKKGGLTKGGKSRDLFTAKVVKRGSFQIGCLEECRACSARSPTQKGPAKEQRGGLDGV